MPRKKKQQIKTNDTNSLEGLLQETYNDACANINDAQTTINEMANAAEPEDVDDLAKIAKEKTSALKIKDSAMRVKLEIAKLQSDIIKHSGNAQAAINERSGGKVDLNDFRTIRRMIEDSSNNEDLGEE
jgi:hypothetical protein